MNITARSVVASIMAFLLVWALVPFAWADDVATEENSTNESSQIESEEQTVDPAEVEETRIEDATEAEASDEAAADEQDVIIVDEESVEALSENEVSTQADTVTVTPGWELIGTCEWKIDGDSLFIRPAGDGSEGVLPEPSSTYESGWPWSSYHKDGEPWPTFDEEYNSIHLLKKIKAGNSLKGIFGKLSSPFCTTISGLENLDTSATTDMSWMFGWYPNENGYDTFEAIDVSNFDTSNVTNMSNMFLGCNKLTSLDVGNFDTSNVTDMSGMFSGCTELSSLDVSGFNTANVDDMSNMFLGCNKLTSLDISKFDTSKVTDMSGMFADYSGAALDFSHFDTSSVTDMSGMFAFYSGAALDFSRFDTSNVVNMSRMFAGYSGAALDFSHLDTSSVTDMSGMFDSYRSSEPLNLSHFNTSKVTNMSEMFQSSELKSINLKNFDTSNVTNMSFMFAGCYEMESLDISPLDTSNVTDMAYMFAGLEKLSNLDLSSLNTSKVTNMTHMFGGSKESEYGRCSSLTSLNLSGLNTSNVTDMSGMFWGCESLKTLNLSNLNTSSVTDMYAMFWECPLLTELDLSSFDTRRVIDTVSSGSSGDFNNMETKLFVDPYDSASNLEKISIGKNFTLQTSFPDKTWYNKEGQSFTPANIPVGTANTYATSMELFDSSVSNKTISLDQKEKTIRVNDSPFTLVATVLPVDTEDKSVVWTSSNPSVATVSAQGVVTPLQSGATMITARSGLAAAVCYITVTPAYINTTPDSVVEGAIAIHDAELAKELENYSLRIANNDIEDLTPLEQAIKEASKKWNDTSYLVNIFDIDLVNNATGAVYEWTSNHRVTLSIHMNEELQKIAETHNFCVWYIAGIYDAQINKVDVEERTSWVDQDVLYFDTNHLSTYAVSATLKPVDVPANATIDTEASVLAKTEDSLSNMIMTLGLAGFVSLLVLVGTSAYQSRRRDSK